MAPGRLKEDGSKNASTASIVACLSLRTMARLSCLRYESADWLKPAALPK